MNSSKLLPWLKLARVSAVFTAMADIFAGYLLTNPDWTPPGQFLALLAASALLYLSGMVFNDVFDLQIDRIERPQRPIPSGAISLRAATILGSLLVALGLMFAALAGKYSLAAAAILVVAIFAYDGGLKKTLLGPFSMGACRFLNIILGASGSAASFADLWGQPQLWVAAAMGIYIAGVTWFARSEATLSKKLPLMTGLTLVNCGLLLLALWMLHIPEKFGIDMGPIGSGESTPTLLLCAAIGFSINRRALIAIYDPKPGNVQPTIGSMLLSVITINAMVILYRLGQPGLIYALLTLILLFPAVAVKRWISMT